ncbi:electron transport complex subunit RsxG [Denitratisoma sp. DHT3]|uniref:electron transport complex subunit RsxG n=1 Tax=Denitratisoma sp. DHT3 TaxID=1981880 RepID=UPI00119844C0|nr:electron transport complex subunit RsxG [Denitratisoma sp. DHT3]QDX80363.1 electron transport complex subunit RsxG [Denitratisoma sp. DHT3]
MSSSTPETPLAPVPAAAPSITRISVRTGAILAVFCAVFTILMAATYLGTKPALDASALAEKLGLIDAVLPRGGYDNDLLADYVTLPPLPALGLDEATRLYRARQGGEPRALVLEAAAPDGYSGRINLILAVDTDGRLKAVRVTQHRETPGLGDYIDPKKDRNKRRPWITQFNDKGFGDVVPEHWKVKKDGGQFDQMAGATISARAVTNATRRALEWAAARRERLFALPTQGSYQE